MIVYSGVRRVFKIMSAKAPSSCDLDDVCRMAVDHCIRFGFGIDLTFRDDIIEARPNSDPALLAAAFERRAAERARPIGRDDDTGRFPEAAHSRNNPAKGQAHDHHHSQQWPLSN